MAKTQAGRQIPRRAGKALQASLQASLSWLKKGKLGFDGERIIIGVQDQGLLTNGFKKMAGLSTNDQCRFCHAAVESATHLVSACEVMLGDGHEAQQQGMQLLALESVPSVQYRDGTSVGA